ncbi:polyprenyl synthetase family protein [Ammoniphilus sp. YIM 78166]|uniref:polyprenyl synthetase family protein n=1 Tax=Ammoniphilus sp. YIM 78166 TaxID=1644106 RepID=UPI00106F1E2B|nr:farnesyl diphosphate synthase [Ammoniphilus sp. YIM 78166]
MLNLHNYLTEKKTFIEQALPAFLPTRGVPPLLAEAMEYSLFAGGKRIRPILLLATIEAFEQDPVKGLPAACAIEMIHTYSLIHDDLPAMDNDDFRRGMPTNHKKFGEATAILAGDGLLTEAFRAICSLQDQGIEAATVLPIICELSKFAGPQGMVGGQMADLLGEGKQLQLSELQYIHHHKTADLLVFCIRTGARLGGADEAQLEKLTRFARNIGLAFQIQDDILDVYGDEEKLGKPVGSDTANEKSTYPSLIGLEQSQIELERLIVEAKEALAEAGVQTQVLGALADYIIKRDQ